MQRSKLRGIRNWGRNRAVKTNRFICPVFDIDVLWPNGWMDEDETWHGGRSQPRPLCVRWGPISPSPNFGPCLLWPNCWMDQDATWYGGRPRPRPREMGASFLTPPKEGAQPPIFGPCLLWPNGRPFRRPSQLLLSTCCYRPLMEVICGLWISAISPSALKSFACCKPFQMHFL